jgi:hypothetical protein
MAALRLCSMVRAGTSRTKARRLPQVKCHDQHPRAEWTGTGLRVRLWASRFIEDSLD